MQTSSFLADLATLARLSVPTLSEQQAETRAAAAFLQRRSKVESIERACRRLGSHLLRVGFAAKFSSSIGSGLVTRAPSTRSF
jgi:hypothetical protein